MADFLDQKRRELDDRLRELRPLVEEYERLTAAMAALAGVGTATATTSRPVGRRTKTKAAAKAQIVSPPRAGDRTAAGTRAYQALSLVERQPGITIPELAAAMGIKQSYLYRVMPTLEEGGRIKQRGRGWHAREKS